MGSVFVAYVGADGMCLAAGLAYGLDCSSEFVEAAGDHRHASPLYGELVRQSSAQPATGARHERPDISNFHAEMMGRPLLQVG
jgi:hypothetical protein